MRKTQSNRRIAYGVVVVYAVEVTHIGVVIGADVRKILYQSPIIVAVFKAC